MLFLKANPELKLIFSHLIKTMNIPIKWNSIFVIINNNMILVGEVRSLIFHFDNRKVQTNLLEIPIEEQKIEMLPEDELITNILNMTLYAFGKWGTITGLKVEKDYKELNSLFSNILKAIDIEPGYFEDTFRFYKEGVRITFEDVVNDALLAVNKEKEEDSEKEKETQEQYELGLWHNMIWKNDTCEFKRLIQEEELEKRIGKNFYRVNYNCPYCQAELYMTSYPDEGIDIETEEGSVYLARAYTCDACNSFYTPRPGKLLKEKEVYSLRLEEDRMAYEDYLEVLGKKGSKTSSYKFNEFNWQRNKQEEAKQEEQEETKQEETEQEETKQEEAKQKEAKQKEAKQEEAKREQVNQKEVKQAKQVKANRIKEITVPHEEQGSVKSETQTIQNNKKSEVDSKGFYRENRLQENKTFNYAEKHRLEFLLYSPDSLKQMIKKTESELAQNEEEEKKEYLKAATQILKEKLNTQYEVQIRNIQGMSLRQLKDLKKQIFKEKHLDQAERNVYTDKINERLLEIEKAEITQKVISCKTKSYQELSRVIDDVKAGEGLEEIRSEVLHALKVMRTERGKQEAEVLIKKIPANITRKQYEIFVQTLEQYKEVDLSPYYELLEEKRDAAEKNEISDFVKSANKKDRKSLNYLYEQLQTKHFCPKNTAPYLDKIKDKIYEFDKAEIAKICPDIMEISFQDGLKIYDTISQGMFLPEIKRNALEQVSARLTRIKMDENIQLVRKLKKEMDDKGIDLSRIYFYEARRFASMRGEKQEGDDVDAIECAMQTYAETRYEYEYPILICDASRRKDGSRGFMITPERIFYENMFDSGILNIMNVDEVEFGKNKLNKHIQISKFVGKKLTLPQKIDKKQRHQFALVLDEFIAYLQEKPVSRSVAYLEKEKHAVICCYRCGFVYEGEDVCPKCGYKSNN